MKLSLITINYNGADQTIRLLDSLKDQTDLEFSCIVVDNASKATDRQKLEAAIPQYPFAQLILSETNTGFSGGNNIGIKKALEQGTEWIVMINNDAWVKPQFIAGIKAFVSSRGGQIVAIPIQEGLPAQAGDRTAYCGEVTWFSFEGHHIYDQEKALQALPEGQAYAIGAGIAIHRSVFEKIGFWDERYFLYFEDIDFSLRAQKAGIKLEIAPQVIHHEPSSSTKKLGSPLLLRYHARNALLFNAEHGLLEVKIALPFWSFFAILKQVLKIVILPEKRAESKAILAGIMDFWQGDFGHINENHRH